MNTISSKALTHESGLEIAIIGASGRFPKAKTIEKFWENLKNGVESISFFSHEELLSLGIDPVLLNTPNYVKARGVLEDKELFDAAFFGFNPREAEITDPQHRIFLECAWEALENAGYNSETYRGLIGMYAGTSLNSYMLKRCSNVNFMNSVDGLQLLIGNDKDFLTTRVSYKLNLKGTSINVQTACSTSLVAVHLACRSLLSGECHMALAGGVSISETLGYFYREGGVGSPDGHCRAFDAKAQGTVGGDGVGIVVLKRLKDALADGDTIHAVIKGSATNNDGSFKVSYTAPSVDSQARVIRTAQVVSEVEPETITYIESHGTGTDLGDPIEIAALTQAFGTNNHLKGFCAIGSVKTNIGHLDAAAGVTSLIKTVLALKHKQIPPSLHFEQPNPKIDFANSPFYVNTTLSEWKANGTPRRAGVSSFGIGGTNAHVILEEAPVVKASSPSRSWQLLMLSAKTDSALETATANLANYLQQHLDLNLADVTYTLQVGRRTFEHRRTVICHSIEDAVTALQDPKQVLTNIQENQDRQVAFMFPGLGTHYVNMAIELYQSEPTFRAEIDRCCELLKAHLGVDLRDILYPLRNSENVELALPLHDSVSTNLDLRKMLGRSSELADVSTLPATSLLNQTYLAQPAIFVIEYALAKLWIEWGIRPVAMIGYSIGEYVAACLAEVLSLEEALTLVAKRAQLIQELPNGAMLAVPVSQQEIQPLLNESLSLSAINGSSLCVIGGTTVAVEELEQQLTQKGLVCRRLQTTHAFHSLMMDEKAPALRDLVKTFNFQPPKIPYLSNVTGVWITADEATDPNYWVKHLCEPVQFASGIQQLWEKQNPILLEVGPGQTLCSLALQCRENDLKVNRLVLPCLRHSYDSQSDMALLLSALGQLWLSGVQINWSGFYAHERRHRLPLPTYPFERQRYWVEAQQNISDVNLNEALQQRLDIKDWFYIPSWKRSVLLVSLESKRLSSEKHCWLVFIDTCGIGTQIIEKLKYENQNVIAVEIGKQFSQVSEWEYTINPQNRDDYNALLKAIHLLGKIPTIIVHLWNVTADEHIPLGLENLEKAQDIGFWCLLFLTQALGERNIENSIQISVVSNNMQQLLDEEWLCPEKATILGPCKVIPQEYSNITCRSIDIKLPQSNTTQRQQLIDYLLIELTASSSDQVIAYRGNQRWVQCFERLPIESQDISTTRLRKGGVYLITGGLGGIGLAMAEYLVKTVQAKIVLIGRSELPPKAEWEQWLLSHQEEDLLSTKIKKVLVLEELGAEVLVLAADVANVEQMQAVVNQARDRFGKIHGVIHAAGVPGGGLIQVKTTELAASVLKPKVNGTLILDAVLQDVNLDFMVLFSSNSAILGGLGHVDYCAANAFLDAFAHYNFYQRQIPTISINWDAWQWDAWEDSFLSFAPTIQAEVKQARSKYGITFKEGVDAFSRILSKTLPQQVVSTSNLEASIEKHKIFALPVFQEISDKFYQFKQTHPRPVLGTAYVAPSDELEQKIADIWQELLGVKQVGVHDNFFNLGGHSLLAIQLVSRLREDFQVELSLRHVFGSPTIGELALIVEDMILGELEELEELTPGETKDHVSVRLNQEQAPKNIEPQRYKLPNNLEIFYQTKAEADYFYEDIFKNRVYLKHGITLRDRACIFDVGANIGLFTLFANQSCNNPTVYAFEPVPDLFEILRLNTALYSVNAKLFNLGLSNETKTAKFTFYPNSSGMSSFYSDKEEEKEVLKTIMLNQLQVVMAGMDRVMEHADELLEERFKEQQLTCQVKTISDVISENDIEGIDLLKIDVQKSELDVIKGIQKNDWSKIKQIIIEVHDIQGRLNEITNLLISQSYHVVSEQEDLYRGSLIHNIYAIRK